jgi:hypothetical protein
MVEAKEPFLERWSRLKREQAKPAAPTGEAAAPASAKQGAEPAAAEPPLPPVESLTQDSDFAPFMNPRVPEMMRRAALKKLFQDPRYNVVDKFEAYWEDYTKAEGIPPELLEKLEQARRHVFGDRMDQAQPKEVAREESSAAASERSAKAQHAEGEGSPVAAPPTQKKNGAGTQDA